MLQRLRGGAKRPTDMHESTLPMDSQSQVDSTCFVVEHFAGSTTLLP